MVLSLGRKMLRIMKRKKTKKKQKQSDFLSSGGLRRGAKKGAVRTKLYSIFVSVTLVVKISFFFMKYGFLVKILFLSEK